MGGELDEPIVPAAVSVRDPDITARGDHDVGGPVEMALVVPCHPGLAKRHRHLTPLVQLEDLVSHTQPHPLDRPRVTDGRPLRHPEESLMIQEESVGPGEQSRPELVDEVAFHVELEDRIDLRNEGAVVCSAARQHPEVLSVRIGKDATRNPYRQPVGHLRPVVLSVVGIACNDLGSEASGPPDAERGRGKEKCDTEAKKSIPHHGLPATVLHARYFHDRRRTRLIRVPTATCGDVAEHDRGIAIE